MAGIGKTTLAQIVYNNDRVEKHFHLRIWVCVSDQFDVVRVTKTILRSVTLKHTDLNDLNLRIAKQYGCRIVVDTDAHSTEELDQMRYGITQLRRAWLTPDDVLNTRGAKDFLAALRPRP